MWFALEMTFASRKWQKMAKNWTFILELVTRLTLILLRTFLIWILGRGTLTLACYFLVFFQFTSHSHMSGIHLPANYKCNSHDHMIGSPVTNWWLLNILIKKKKKSKRLAQNVAIAGKIWQLAMIPLPFLAGAILDFWIVLITLVIFGGLLYSLEHIHIVARHIEGIT